MHAQVVKVRLQPGKLDEAVDLWRGSVLPAARQQQGFRSAYLLLNREVGEALSVSLWESEADLAAIEGSGFYQDQIAKFAAVLAGAPERDVLEVAVFS